MISLFFSLFACFVIWVSVIFSQWNLSSPPPHILSWLSLALQPIFFGIFRYIQKEGDAPIFNPVRLGIISISLLLLTYFFHLDSITFLLVVTAIVTLTIEMDERILFTLALIFLLGTIYTLLIDDRATAERLAILVYYSLVLWVGISLIQKPFSHLIHRLPSYRFPSWWQSYVSELTSLMSLMHQILPVTILGLLVWSVSPWRYLVSFDTQFIGSLVLIYVITSVVSRHEDRKIVKYLLPIMMIFSLLLTWWMFVLEFWIRGSLIIVLLFLLVLAYTRGEYAKGLAKKILSL